MKNFAVGGVSGGADRAASWGRWAFGYYGDAYNRSVDDRGQFSHFRIGGGLAIALMATVLLGGGPWVFVGMYLGMLAGAAVTGAVTGIISGGFEAVQDGRERRQAAQLQQAQQRDSNTIDTLSQQQEKLQNSISKTQDKIDKLQERKNTVHNRMQTREAKATPKAGGFAERELQRRAAVQQQVKGK